MMFYLAEQVKPRAEECDWHVFTRILCDRCGKDMLAGLSCTGRGIRPSCEGRRVAQGGTHAVDKVFPSTPVRQFVVTFPFELRPLLVGALRGDPGRDARGARLLSRAGARFRS